MEFIIYITFKIILVEFLTFSYLTLKAPQSITGNVGGVGPCGRDVASGKGTPLCVVANVS